MVGGQWGEEGQEEESDTTGGSAKGKPTGGRASSADMAACKRHKGRVRRGSRVGWG
jgi:hypothetical protein